MLSSPARSTSAWTTASGTDLDDFFDNHDPLTQFFAKSIEQVQGDERDHIIFSFSLGYGYDEHGKLPQRFGP